jgi:hypothetical protein
LKQDQSYRYAGLSQVQMPGIAVAEAADQLRRLAYAEERMMFLYASRVVTIPERDLKVLLGRLQYEAGGRADQLRQRIQELRVSAKRLKQSPDENLTTFFNELEHLPGTDPFLAALVDLVLPALVAGYRDYLAATNHLADYPSVRILKANLKEAEEHLQLLRIVQTEITPDDADKQLTETWKRHLKVVLDAASGVLGIEDGDDDLPEWVATEPYRIPHELRRDDTFRRVWDFEKPPLEQVAEHLDYMMSIRLSEVNVAEGLALVLCETADMSWSFYMDISHHLWDEMRHSLFGEAAIEATYGERGALPLRDYEGQFAMETAPLEQYAVLGLEIEGANMRYPPGKRQEWEFCRDMADHPLMTTFQDFDWADEVLHVNIARRQLDQWFEGGLKFIAPFSKAGKAHRSQVKSRHKPELVTPAD